jgi:hypothetical protein
MYITFHHALFYWSPALLLAIGLIAVAVGGQKINAILHAPNFELVAAISCAIVGILFLQASWRLWSGARAWIVRPGQLIVIRRGGRRIVVDAQNMIRLGWNVVGSIEDAKSNEEQIYETVAIMRGSRNIVLLDGVPAHLYPEIAARLLKWMGVEHLAGISGAVKAR